MTHQGFSKRALRAASLAGAIVVASGAWVPLHAQQAHDGSQQAHDNPRRTVTVRISSVGADRTTSDSMRVIVYSAGPARVGIGDAELKPLTDTLRLSSLPAITTDVSDADVHIRLLSPGRLRLSAEVTGGRALRFTATGRHVVVLKGGVGADTITDP
jgi:hypothetical protein